MFGILNLYSLAQFGRNIKIQKILHFNSKVSSNFQVTNIKNNLKNKLWKRSLAPFCQKSFDLVPLISKRKFGVFSKIPSSSLSDFSNLNSADFTKRNHFLERNGI